MKHLVVYFYWKRNFHLISNISLTGNKYFRITKLSARSHVLESVVFEMLHLMGFLGMEIICGEYLI